MTTQFKQTQSNSWSRTGGAGTQPTTAFSNVEKKASLASVCSGPSGPLPAIWGLSRRFGEACCLRGLADLRLRIVARPTRAPRVERSLESPLHLPVRPRLILPHPWFCRYEHLVQQHQQQKAQSSATAHGVRGRRRRGRRSRAQRHMWHKSAATPREVRARLGPATAHATWHWRAGGEGGLQQAARGRATAQIGMGDTTTQGAGEREGTRHKRRRRRGRCGRDMDRPASAHGMGDAGAWRQRSKVSFSGRHVRATWH